MNAIKFIKLYGLHSARVTVEDAQENTHYCTEAGYHSIKLDVAYEPCPDCVSIPDLKRLVESVDLVNNCGGLAIANKITFQKRLRNEKATHFIQHPENQKLIQLLGRNQRKPKEAIKFDLFEQAITDYEAIYCVADIEKCEFELGLAPDEQYVKSGGEHV